MRACSNGSASANRRSRLRIGLSHEDEYYLKQELRRRSPSEPWVEAQIKSAIDVDADGDEIVYRYHDPHAFPPGGANTKMRRCCLCGVFNPPNAMEGGACLDHARHEGWGPSPSAMAFIYLQLMNIDQQPLVLEPEDVESLEREIRHYSEHFALSDAP
jgi:hypothetical protein